MRFKTSIIKETIELEQNGEVVKTIPFTFDSAKKWADVNRIRFRMAENKEKPDEIGKLFLELLSVVLGPSSKDLIEYYDGNWEGMVIDISPLFLDVIYPACDKAHKTAINGLKKAKRRG